MKACGLSILSLPCRRTFDRRLKTISIDIKERITTMGHLFVSESIAKPYIMAIDRYSYQGQRSCLAQELNGKRNSA